MRRMGCPCESSLASDCKNEMGRGLTPKQVIMEVSHNLRGDSGIVYHDLYFGGKIPIEMKNVGLRVVDSHTGNHLEDDFTPLETIQRLCSVFGRRSYLGFEGETSELKGR
ncbi:hypothetical protein Tco_1100264, partial [Tanacetum coccineum]